jgi:hypothetical protein
MEPGCASTPEPLKGFYDAATIQRIQPRTDHEAARIADPDVLARSMERRRGVTAMRARQLYRGRQPAFVLVQVRRPRVQGFVLRAGVLAGTLEIMSPSNATTDPAIRTFVQYEIAM